MINVMEYIGKWAVIIIVVCTIISFTAMGLYIAWLCFSWWVFLLVFLLLCIGIYFHRKERRYILNR